MHRRFRGHTCATTYQLRPFPKDLFALQSAHIPVQWVYLENIILTTRRAAAAAAASANANANFKEFLGHKMKHSLYTACVFDKLNHKKKLFPRMNYAASQPCKQADALCF